MVEPVELKIRINKIGDIEYENNNTDYESLYENMKNILIYFTHIDY